MEFGITIAKLQKSYWNRSNNIWNSITALDLEDVFIPFGKTTVILGRSGSGKSTLLSILGLLEPPDDLNQNGHTDLKSPITFNFPFNLDSYDKSKFAIEEFWQNQELKDLILRKHFGFVFQDSFLFPGLSVKQNIHLPSLLNGLSQEKFDDLWQKSLDSGLFEEFKNGGGPKPIPINGNSNKLSFIERIKSSIKHHRGEATPDKYSGGQLQRFSLIRSILHDPSIIFADEPTGNLDPNSADKVFLFLKGWQNNLKEKTLVLVTHDVELARRYADRILIIDNHHGIKNTDVFDAKLSNKANHTVKKWDVSLDQMTNLMSENGTVDSKEEKKLHKVFSSNQNEYDGFKKSDLAKIIKFAWSFSRWDFWPKTPNLKWTSIVGLFITSLLALTSFLILGFYLGSSKYLELIQSNPFIHSLNISRPLTDPAIDKSTLSQIANITATTEDPESFSLGNSGNQQNIILSYASGFNRRSLWGTLIDPDLKELDPVRLTGRTIDPSDPVMQIIEDNLLFGRSFQSNNDLGLIVSKDAMNKLGLSKISKNDSPRILYSKYGSGIDARVRKFPILGISERLPEPGGDFIMSNYFYAQLVNHYFTPTSLSSFEVGFLPSMQAADDLLLNLEPAMNELGLRGDRFIRDNQFILKFSYINGRARHEDLIKNHFHELFKLNPDFEGNNSFTLLPFFRPERSISEQDTTIFTYGSLFIKEFKYARGLRTFLQMNFKADMNLGMIESLGTIHTMRKIISGIVIGMLLCLGFTGLFVVYSVFSQFVSRSAKQFGVLKTMGVDWKNFALIHFFEVLILFSCSIFIGIFGSLFLGRLLDSQLASFFTAFQVNYQFFEISLLHIFILTIMMFITYAIAAGLAVKNIYLKSAMELIKDQRNLSPQQKVNLFNWKQN